MYAYYPGYGWLWLAAPWVFGIGPQSLISAITAMLITAGMVAGGMATHPVGYHGGYPSGYHGIVYSHVGSWQGRNTWVSSTRAAPARRAPTGRAVVRARCPLAAVREPAFMPVARVGAYNPADKATDSVR